MRFLVFSLVTVLFTISIYSQTTNFNSAWSTGSSVQCGRLKSIEIRNDGVIATIEVKALKALKRLEIFSTSNTYILSGNTRLLQLSGLITDRGIVNCGYGTNWGWSNVPLGAIQSYQPFFKGTLPSGTSTISIVDYGDYNGAHGYCFNNYQINNPRRNYLPYQSEFTVKQHIDQNNDGVCGIYEPIDDTGAKLACVKKGNEYCLIYLSSPANYPGKSLWQIGDIKATLRMTASGLMKADWYRSDKSAITSYVAFDGVSMTAVDNTGETKYLKTYPVSSPTIGSNGSQEVSEWSGTGFALNNGYIVTNFHVVEDASEITIQGVNGSSFEYKASVIEVDKKNDLALIKITDSRFKGFGNIPYAVKETTCDVGADIFVLGYPLTSYMGEKIKLTNGIISSKSGFKDDITTYQISAPVQPGNSGGPMFDKNGNVVGIVNAGIPNADNVGYAIKTTYLFNLIKSSVSASVIPNNNIVAGKSLPEKVKILQKYVFYIKCK